MWEAARYIYAACQEKLDKRSENSACHGPYRDSLYRVAARFVRIFNEQKHDPCSGARSTRERVVINLLGGWKIFRVYVKLGFKLLFEHRVLFLAAIECVRVKKLLLRRFRLLLTHW